MKKEWILMSLIMLAFGGTVWAAGDMPAMDVELTYATKYIWHGYDLFNNKAAFQPGVTADLGSGFSVNFWGSYPAASGNVNATEQDYSLLYDMTLCEGEQHQMDVTANYIYYDFIDEPSTASDAQEIGVGVSWPKMCTAGLVPSYYVGNLWVAKTGSALGGDAGGWIHVFAMEYDMTVPGMTADMPEHIITLMTDLTYNDGYAAADADHDWSHATFGASTDMTVNDMTFTPALYWQASMDDSVNDEDELYATLTMSFSF